MITDIFIEGERLDLFEDENITVTQGVQDVKDVSKLFADFSQSFNVPASKNNNRIFKNYYNQDIDNGFDARTRKPSIININTIPFKTGKMQLNGVQLKNNKPSSYKITFFGDVIKVKDLIGDDKLNTLDWLSNFNHPYDETNVETGLTDGLDFTVDGIDYDKAIIYPLISYQRQYFYNSNSSDTTSTDTLVNIGYDVARDDGVRFDDLKPAIKLSLIIEAIQQKYGFNFVGGFFESEIFNDIYVNLNKTTSKLSNGILEYENVNTTAPPNGSAPNDYLRYTTTVTPKAGFEDVFYKIRLSINDNVIYESTTFLTGTQIKAGNLDQFSEDINCVAEIITLEDFEFDATTRVQYRSIGINETLSPYPLSYTDQSIVLTSVILNEIKDIKTYDFLTGLFKTFNLVVTSSGDDILVEDLQTWYTQGDIIDITPYVDTEKKGVDKGIIFNKIDFSFQDSEQILADEFKQSNNRVYGNEELTLYTDSTETERLDGETLDIESQFENPIYERLFDLDNNTQTNIQYIPYFNRSIQSIAGAPFMFYANQVSVSSNTLGFKGITAYSELSGNVLMPTHSQIIDFDSFNLNFAAEINEYTSEIFTDTIYSRFYADYIGDVFSNKRRNYTYKAILPLSILNSLKLNDRLVIGNTRYIINKIASNLTVRGDELELINDIYDAPLVSDVLRSSLFTPSQGRFAYNGRAYSTQYIGLSDQNAVKLDTGDGTSWFTVNSIGKGTIATVKFTLTENNSGNIRSGGIQVNDGLNNPIYYITQSE